MRLAISDKKTHTERVSRGIALRGVPSYTVVLEAAAAAAPAINVIDKQAAAAANRKAHQAALYRKALEREMMMPL